MSGAAGAVFPLSFGIIRDEFPPDRMKVGIGLLSAVFGIGGGFGLVLSGLIVDNTSWRWLFVVGALGVAIALVLVRRFVPESPVRSTSRIDVPGAVLLSVVLVAFLLGAVARARAGAGRPRPCSGCSRCPPSRPCCGSCSSSTSTSR